MSFVSYRKKTYPVVNEELYIGYREISSISQIEGLVNTINNFQTQISALSNIVTSLELGATGSTGI